MSPEEFDAALDRLYATPPDGFTRERDALAKRLAAVDKAAGAEVRKLRRPPVTAWALNRVAATNPADLAALVQMDAEVARLQREGAGREMLAAAGQRRRERIRDLAAAAAAVLADAGHPDSPATRERLTQTLTAIATDDEGREALTRGRLTQDLTPGSLWDAPVAPPPAPEDPGAQRRRLAEEARAQADELSAAAARQEAEADRAEAAAWQAAEAARRAREAAHEARKLADEAEAGAVTAGGPAPA